MWLLVAPVSDSARCAARRGPSAPSSSWPSPGSAHAIPATCALGVRESFGPYLLLFLSFQFLQMFGIEPVGDGNVLLIPAVIAALIATNQQDRRALRVKSI